MAARQRAATTVLTTEPIGWWSALAAALGVAVYLTALRNPFVYDDHATVLANPSLVDLRNWRFVLVYSLFRPVVNVSYALDAAAWGMHPFGFHLTNLALHALNVWLFLRVVREALRDRAAKIGASSTVPGADLLAAFAAAALFAVHPLMSEAVGYVSGRSELLCGFFFLLAFLAMRRALAVGAVRALAVGWVAFVLALASKETAAAFPFVLLAYDWCCLGGSPADRRRRLWQVHAPLLVLVIIAGLARVSTLLLAERPLADSSWQTLLTQTTVVFGYVRLLVLPIGQSIVHPVRQITSVRDPIWLLSALVLAALAIAAWRVRRREPLALVGALWFLLVLAPSSSIVALRESMAEHRVYLASLGLFLTASAAFTRWVEVRWSGARRRGTWLVLGVAVTTLAACTLVRNRVWMSPVALWTEAVERAPDYWEAHYALGDSLRESGRCGEAVDEYLAVVALRQDHRDAYNNLGICLGETGRLSDARAAFERALAIDPSFARAETNLGGLALAGHDLEGARRHFERAMTLDPRNLTARRQLATLYETSLGDPAEALRVCREALALAPQAAWAAACVGRNEPKLPRGPGDR